MTITIIQKSNLEIRKTNPKIALVLAGGAVTGGTYKLGGLKALNDYFSNRKIIPKVPTTEMTIRLHHSVGASNRV